MAQKKLQKDSKYQALDLDGFDDWASVLCGK
jgi:hypothetical protein